jgi:hypothetical protein
LGAFSPLPPSTPAAAQTVSDLRTTAATGAARARAANAATRAARRSADRGPAAPRRRSERAQGMAAPVYNESVLFAVDRGAGGAGAGGRDRRLLRENTSEEVYTAEHVAALGGRAAEWELFVDGYDADGLRVYDPARGKTCHQCRQKTLGRRTSCAGCGSLGGQFCGDCLFMRYGENADEAAANPAWTCPPCRGLCNCSFHRSRRGWAPTGTLYRRAAAEGYASVAHYLVLNNLAPEAKAAALPLMPVELAERVRAEIAAAAAGGGGAEEEEEEEEAEGAAEGTPAAEAAALLSPSPAAAEEGRAPRALDGAAKRRAGAAGAKAAAPAAKAARGAAADAAPRRGLRSVKA